MLLGDIWPTKEEKKESDKDCLKDGLSERKPLFDGWGDTRVPQTPRMIPLPKENEDY
jgi:hypothetical protein